MKSILDVSGRYVQCVCLCVFLKGLLLISVKMRWWSVVSFCSLWGRNATSTFLPQSSGKETILWYDNWHPKILRQLTWNSPYISEKKPIQNSSYIAFFWLIKVLKWIELCGHSNLYLTMHDVESKKWFTVRSDGRKNTNQIRIIYACFVESGHPGARVAKS